MPPSRSSSARRSAPSSTRRRPRVSAIVGLRCPHCFEGRVFRGVLDMNERCPECGLVFEREPGYFTGAMVVSYAISVALYLALVLVLWWATGHVEAGLALAVVPFLAAVPTVFRYSRVIWMHFDHTLDPHK